jgi:eukaryotic-like serine/threonine-protein kinase
VLRSGWLMVDESGIEPDPRIGSLVEERYKVIEAMASGSMGVVYKAERVPVGKLVAIKFLHAPFANDSEFLARFERETRVMSKLNHPNCVSVVDFGVWDGAPYLVMEYVSGTTLRALIDNGPMPPRRALALIRQIAAGLAHAHAQGVVHRDVKPANIMVSEEIGTGDHVRILDFGLARLRNAVGRDATQSNVVVGTPNYMAPEQTVGGGLIDARTDIYAAGVVLFEMVAGERPFQAEDTLALLGMHRAAPVPRLADRLPEGTPLPRELQELIDQAMAKSPGDRFQSAIELAEAIDAVSSGADGGAVASRTSDARRIAGNAPTMLDLSDAAELITPASQLRSRPRGSFFGSLILLAILVGGVGATVLWIKARSGSKVATAQGAAPALAASSKVDDKPAAATAGSSAAAGSATSGSPATGAAAPAAAGPGSAAAPGSAGTAAAPGPGSATPSEAAGSAAPPEPAGSAVAAGSGEPGAAPPAAEPSPPASPPPAPGGGSDDHAEPPSGPAGSGSDIEMDPATAEDPAPPSTRPANGAEEAANAPRTREEVERHEREKRPPVAPALAITIEAAVRLIQDGKHDLAMASLQELGKKITASAYIPFLLGNLYYDQRWWTVAMDHYAIAIKKNAQYRSNPTLNRNVISMLGSDKTSRKAQGFLKFMVGKPAVPYLKYAAQHDASAQVRRTSGWLLRNL